MLIDKSNAVCFSGVTSGLHNSKKLRYSLTINLYNPNYSIRVFNYRKQIKRLNPTIKNSKPRDPLNRHLILTTTAAAPVTWGDCRGCGGGLIVKNSSSTGIFGPIFVFKDSNSFILRRLDVSVVIVSLLLIYFFLGDVNLEGFT